MIVKVISIALVIILVLVLVSARHAAERLTTKSQPAWALMTPQEKLYYHPPSKTDPWFGSGFQNPEMMVSGPLVGTASTWANLSDDEKITYLVDRYLGYDNAAPADKKVADQNTYIQSLPQDASCTDDYDDCPTWTANGECDINPEYMLYHCASSCKSCALTLQQKQNVTAIMNTRKPLSCVYHGNQYPGPYPYIRDLETYL